MLRELFAWHEAGANDRTNEETSMLKICPSKLRGWLQRDSAGSASLLNKAITNARLVAAKKDLNYLAVFIQIGAKQQEKCAGPPIRLVERLFSQDQKELARGKHQRFSWPPGVPFLLWTRPFPWPSTSVGLRFWHHWNADLLSQRNVMTHDAHWTLVNTIFKYFTSYWVFTAKCYYCYNALFKKTAL